MLSEPLACPSQLCDRLQVALEAAGTGVRSIVLRLPAFVWGNGGSCFIPAQLEAAKKQGKAYYLLPGATSCLFKPVPLPTYH